MIRKIVCTLLLLSFSLCTINMYADEPEHDGTTLHQTYDPKNKKRMPSKNFILCEVINDILLFEANFDYECMTVEITGDSTSGEIKNVITPFEPYVIIPQLSGECTIRCITDAGAIYESTLII